MSGDARERVPGGVKRGAHMGTHTDPVPLYELPYKESQARRETNIATKTFDEVVRHLSTLNAQIRRLYAGQAHVALGYASWDAYMATEFGDAQDRLTRADMSMLHVSLTRGEGGLSVRAVAAVTGASKATVARDASADRADEVSQDETPDTGAKVIGLDGKRHPKTKAVPAPVKPVVPVPVEPVQVVELIPGSEDEVHEDWEGIVQEQLDELSGIIDYIFNDCPPDAVRAVIRPREWDELTRWQLHEQVGEESG